MIKFNQDRMMELADRFHGCITDWAAEHPEQRPSEAAAEILQALAFMSAWTIKDCGVDNAADLFSRAVAEVVARMRELDRS